jgi:RNA polymerase sigma-70 factor (ECF subfamily)
VTRGEELALTAAALAGDQSAYAALYGALRRTALVSASTTLRGPLAWLAEDAAHDAAVKALMALAGFDGRSRLSTWVWRIARNEAVGIWRRERRFASTVLTEDCDPTCRGGQAVVDAGLDLPVLLGPLSARQREALVARYVMGDNLEETAGKLGVTVGTVKNLVFRAKKKALERMTR